jgi:microcystin-dependent protein
MDPFLGEIRAFTWPWAPTGWHLCDGSVLQNSQYQALAALLGNLYGGDGKTTFGLPDLRGRTGMHFGVDKNGIVYQQGSQGGAETVTLTTAQIPPHDHDVNAVSNKADKAIINGNFPAVPSATILTPAPIYTIPLTLDDCVPLVGTSVQDDGGGGPHGNMQPFLVTNFCIATAGLWPPRQ